MTTFDTHWSREGRVLGIDLGDVRTGLALSDPLQMLASPVKRIEERDALLLARHVAAFAAEHEVVCIVLGLPLLNSGELGAQAQRVLDFVQLLKAETALPVFTQDERFTTASVTRSLIQADLSRKKRKQVVDKLAAQQILQSFLDRAAVARRQQAQEELT